MKDRRINNERRNNDGHRNDRPVPLPECRLEDRPRIGCIHMRPADEKCNDRINGIACHIRIETQQPAEIIRAIWHDH